MARKTAASQAKAVADAAKQAALQQVNPQDAHNILVLLDRVQTTGHREATLLAVLAQKLTLIKGSYTGEPSGEDSTPAS